MKIHCKYDELLPLTQIAKHLNPGNRNKHPAEQVDAIVKQFDYQGIRHPSACRLLDSMGVKTFLGSGSTLIACEKTNRRCYGMEIDPLYCDVILDRWAKFTGQEPKREDGTPWSYIKDGGD